ncbi:MAG: hypothetical protein Q4D94_12970 [Bacillota bacterium]|nr:hypothetical protein [Bacillota bacterium]
MHNLDEIIKMYFSFVSVEDILKGAVKARCFPKEEYTVLASAYLNCYSDTEQENLYDYIQNSNEHSGGNTREKRNNLNVFSALGQLAEELFVMEENEPKCRYEYLLRLREIEEYVDLELLMAAFLVQNRINYGGDDTLKNKYLTRNVSIDHNNLQLKRIMELGIAENHFHLYGSTPMFHLIWIQMMNGMNDEKYASLFREIDSNPRMVRTHYKQGYIEGGCEEKILKAALIRWVLFRMLMDDGGKDIEEREQEREQARAILSGDRSIKDYYSFLQKKIRVQRAAGQILHNKEVADYAMSNIDASNIFDNCFGILAGERWMLYELLVQEQKEAACSSVQESEWIQWFYAYLVIKNQIRNEILQTNSKIGFENFSMISHRKNAYVNYGLMEQQALKSSLDSRNIQKFEIRITPANTAEGYADKIRYLENILWKNNKRKDAVFYVFHFTKSQDNPKKGHLLYRNFKECRHYDLRNKLRTQAAEMERFRDLYPDLADKVLGIDACAQEIGCRPEVFAPIFRRLSKHTSSAMLGKKEIPQLRMTYHVGEDFLDVVDGLRAVDEAIHFLNLKCGARIGHGTVLGISVENWYRRKRNTIILSKQDYLDNIVWLYHKINEFCIEGCSQLLEFLMQEFEKVFYEVYHRNIDGTELRRIWQESGKSYSKLGFQAEEYQYTFDIFTYYEAWKLRGDDPSLYVSGYYKEPIFFTDKEKHLVNWEYTAAGDVRWQRNVSILYYYYHYNRYVYEEGRKKIERYMPDCYVDGVVKVQKAMQSFIGKCGIGIECNPSSNLMISTMRSYDEHPIVQFYNKDLEKDPEKLQECLQLFVSINTDDKGVFHTSLENEYALMACAMEKVKDKQGKAVYNRQMVYQWIDNIRRMGLQQSFLGRRAEENESDY